MRSLWLAGAMIALIAGAPLAQQGGGRIGENDSQRSNETPDVTGR